MAKDFNFDDVQDQHTDVEIEVTADTNVSDNIVNNNQSTINQNNAKTYNVVITDHNAPMVILFGPPSCGKTMTLVRLTRYLSGTYDFMPDQAFRNSTDTEFNELCKNFNAAVGADKAAEGTKYIDFMLLRVNERRNGRTICQFVESPGEFLFDPQNPTAQFPAYLHQIIASNNRKIWLIFLEPGMSQEDRFAYVKKIQDLRSVIDSRDRIIFVENKVDLPATSSFILSPTNINMDGLFRYVDGLYPKLFKSFTVNGLFWPKKRYDFTAFQTGTYVEGQDANGKPYKSFQSGHDSHPRRLWDIIYKRIRG